MKQSYWEENWLDKLFASYADDVQLDFFMFLLSRGNHLVHVRKFTFYIYGFMSGLFYFFVLFVIRSGRILAFALYGIIVYYF